MADSPAVGCTGDRAYLARKDAHGASLGSCLPIANSHPILYHNHIKMKAEGTNSITALHALKTLPLPNHKVCKCF